MKKKVKLADVLWDAANKRLWPGTDFGKGHQWSCLAANAAAVGRDQWSSRDLAAITPVSDFLASLGCNNAFSQFNEFELTRSRQGVRYMWLLLAMHVAEDEGIEIEVERD